ncbi:MAG: hypothetical protein R2735_10550 [Microthrixaceae bacterium]
MSIAEQHTNEELIGRADIDDLEAILSVTNTDRDEVISAVENNSETIFTWDYEKGRRAGLDKLYEKAKHSQWDGQRICLGTPRWTRSPSSWQTPR